MQQSEEQFMHVSAARWCCAAQVFGEGTMQPIRCAPRLAFWLKTRNEHVPAWQGENPIDSHVPRPAAPPVAALNCSLRYTMGVPFNDQGQLTVTGTVAGLLTLDVEKNDPVKTLRIKVTSDAPVIGIQLNNDYGHFRCISCIAAMEP